MRPAISRIALTGTLVLALAPVTAGAALRAAPGSISIRLVGQGGVSADPLARSYIVARLAPGARIQRVVEVANTTHRTADVAVYSAAARMARGTFSFAAGGTANDLSSWTRTSDARLRLPAGTRRLETITITVPKRAPAGERYAVVWAEMSAAAPARPGVKLVNRVGIRMYVSVGHGGAPAPRFSIGLLAARRSASGGRVVVATVYNRGRGTLELTGSVTLSRGPGGIRAGPIRINLARAIAPGDSRHIGIRLATALPRGPWRIHLQLTSRGVSRNAWATATFPAARRSI